MSKRRAGSKAASPASGAFAGERVLLISSSTGTPAAFLGQILQVDVARWLGSNVPTIGQKTMANSVPVVVASDQSAIPVIGTDIEGVSIFGPLLVVAGVDALGNARRFLMGADGTLKARETLVAMTWVAAIVTAPAANAVIADTGALAAGDYDFDVNLGAADTTAALGKCVILEHRNAANAATLFTLAMIAQQDSQTYQFRRYTLAANERLRVINGAVAGAAASRYHGAIGRRLS